MVTDDEWDELLDAWKAWSRQPSDRNTAVRLSVASAAVADHLKVPAYRVATLLADGLRSGLSHEEVVERLANGWPFDIPQDTHCVHCGPTAAQLKAISDGLLDTLYPAYDGDIVDQRKASQLPPCGHPDRQSVMLGAEAYRRAWRVAS